MSLNFIQASHINSNHQRQRWKYSQLAVLRLQVSKKKSPRIKNTAKIKKKPFANNQCETENISLIPPKIIPICSKIAASVADVQSAIEHIFPLVYEFRKKRTPAEPAQPVNTLDVEHDEEQNDVMEYSSGRAATKPVKQKAIKRKYPFGMAENDPDEDLMAISDVESDADDNDDFWKRSFGLTL